MIIDAPRVDCQVCNAKGKYISANSDVEVDCTFCAFSSCFWCFESPNGICEFHLTKQQLPELLDEYRERLLRFIAERKLDFEAQPKEAVLAWYYLHSFLEIYQKSSNDLFEMINNFEVDGGGDLVAEQFLNLPQELKQFIGDYHWKLKSAKRTVPTLALQAAVKAGYIGKP